VAALAKDIDHLPGSRIHQEPALVHIREVILVIGYWMEHDDLGVELPDRLDRFLARLDRSDELDLLAPVEEQGKPLANCANPAALAEG
jgi:hypothetical protein